jgi:hypothetical protein
MHAEFFLKKTRRFGKKAWTKKTVLVTSSEIMMSLLVSFRKRLVLPAICLACPLVLSAQNAVPQAGEFSISGARPGDQVRSSVSVNSDGGYVVWEENGTAKTGSQLTAIRLNSSLTPVTTFSVNKITKGDQHKPKVQLLSGGGAIFVWQGNGLGDSDIYARILKNDGTTFATSDVRLNSYLKDQQSEPAVCALQDGGAFVVWQSFGQDGSMFGIYAAKISADGDVSGNGTTTTATVTVKGKKKPKQITITEFQVNQATAFNQRNPSVASLANGNVVVTWISEQERFLPGFPDSTGTVSDSQGSFDVYARLFNPSGAPLSDEILINSGNNVCANPSIAALANGGFAVAWSERDSQSRSNNWDVMARAFSSDGVPTGGDFKVNTTTYGDQYVPHVAANGNDCTVVWTSMGQDGSWEGVFGRVLKNGAEPAGTEFQVNTTSISRQIQPAIASNGGNQFLVSWSSFAGASGMDLFARKYTLNPQQ